MNRVVGAVSKVKGVVGGVGYSVLALGDLDGPFVAFEECPRTNPLLLGQGVSYGPGRYLRRCPVFSLNMSSFSVSEASWSSMSNDPFRITNSFSDGLDRYTSGSNGMKEPEFVGGVDGEDQSSTLTSTGLCASSY